MDSVDVEVLEIAISLVAEMTAASRNIPALQIHAIRKNDAKGRVAA